jgi:hypothetical protein
LEIPRPEPTQAEESTNSYVIDKAVYLQNLDGFTKTNPTLAAIVSGSKG